jgi:hypothetical protein
MPKKVFPNTPEGLKEKFAYRLEQLFLGRERKDFRYKYDALMRWAFVVGIISESEYQQKQSRVSTPGPKDRKEQPTPSATEESSSGTAAEESPHNFMADIAKRGK